MDNKRIFSFLVIIENGIIISIFYTIKLMTVVGILNNYKSISNKDLCIYTVNNIVLDLYTLSGDSKRSLMGSSINLILYEI